MERTYRYKIPGSPDTFIARAKKLAEENKAVIAGNSRQGNISVKGIEGDYRVESKTAVLTIRKKPFYIPWRLLEKEISGFFGR